MRDQSVSGGKSDLCSNASAQEGAGPVRQALAGFGGKVGHKFQARDKQICRTSTSLPSFHFPLSTLHFEPIHPFPTEAAITSLASHDHLHTLHVSSGRPFKSELLPNTASQGLRNLITFTVCPIR